MLDFYNAFVKSLIIIILQPTTKNINFIFQIMKLYKFKCNNIVTYFFNDLFYLL